MDKASSQQEISAWKNKKKVCSQDLKVASSSDSDWRDSETWEANQTSLSKLNEKLINKRWCDNFYNTQTRFKDTARTIQIHEGRRAKFERAGAPIHSRSQHMCFISIEM